jgi:ABC-type glutathione transport system ATPase component
MTLGPEFIVADEPAASMDLSVKAQMLDLMKRFQAEHGIGYLYISRPCRRQTSCGMSPAIMTGFALISSLKTGKQVNHTF